MLGWLLYAAGAIAVLRAVAVVARRTTPCPPTRRPPWGQPVTAPVSVIVPAYNESAGIEAAVRSLLASDHPVEIIVVDDGSTDGTADLVESLRLPNVRVIRQANAGKPAALNTGIAAASYDLLVMVDGDTVFEPDAVRTLVQPFADPRVGAVSGNAKVINRRGLLGPLAAHRVRRRLQPRPAAVRPRPSACPPCPARSAPSGATRCCGSAGSATPPSPRTPT